jgi:hypothetical protein
MRILICAKGCGNRVSFQFGHPPKCCGEFMMRERLDLGHTIESALIFLQSHNYNHEHVRSAIEGKIEHQLQMLQWLTHVEAGLMPDIVARIQHLLDEDDIKPSLHDA